MNFHDMMTTEGYDESLVEDALSEAGYFRVIEQQKLQIQALVRQYRACRISWDEMSRDGALLGLDESLLTWWKQVADWNSTCGTRRESAANLCTALDQESITAEEYTARMKILRYDDEAISRLLDLCQNKVAARKAKAALAQAKADQLAGEKAARQAQQQADRAQREAQQAARLAEKIERGRQARNRLLMDATARLQKTVGVTETAVRDQVDATYAQLMSELGLSQNEAANAVSLAATRYAGPDLPGFINFALVVGEAALKQPWILFAPS